MKSIIGNIRIHFVNFLGFYIITLCFAFFFYISSSHFPAALLKEISDIKIAMITIVSGVISYYYGSSKGKDKEETKTN